MKAPLAAPQATTGTGRGTRRARPGLRADHLTLSRLALLPIPVAMLYQPAPGWRAAALALFVLLGLTDVWDGRLARRQGSSRFGEALDIVADRVFLIVVYGAFANLGIVPLAAFVVIAAREFLVGAVRALPTVEARTGKAGKWRTTAQMYGAGGILLIWIAVAPARPGAAHGAILAMMALILAVTISTAAAYLWRARSEIAAGVRGRPPELLGVVATTLVVPALWAPLAGLEMALSLAVIALVACELARLLLASDLVPGRVPAPGERDRRVSAWLARMAILAAAGATVRALAARPGADAAAFAIVIAMAAWAAFDDLVRFRAAAETKSGPPRTPLV